MDNKFKSLLTIVILGLIQLSLVNCKKDFCQGAFVTGATKLNNGSVFFVADYKWYYVVDFYKGEMPKPEKARRVSDLIPEFNHLNIVVNVPVKIIPTSKNSNKTECVRIENKDRLLFYMVIQCHSSTCILLLFYKQENSSVNFIYFITLIFGYFFVFSTILRRHLTRLR